jgi:voltage-gated potassium channel
MRRIRLFLVVLRRNGGLPLLSGLVVLTLVAALVVLAFEPGVTNLGDALWYCWEVSTTVGLGDVFAVSPVGRIASVVLSLYAIVVTAIVTGVIVTFYQERRDAQLKQSVAELLDKLERLPELDEEELRQISEQVRRYRP